MNTIYAEILTIGDEILYGQTLDTNAHWLSSEMDKIGIRVLRRTTIGDNADHIKKALSNAEADVDLILITGGLGPTKDDLTKPVMAEYFDSDLQLDPDALKEVESFFKSKGRELTDLNRKQAELPDKCTRLPNRMGTAPGMWFESNDKIFVSLPGVPHEMKILITEQVIPRLRKFFQTPVIYHKLINHVGIGESWLSELIEEWEQSLPANMRLAYLPDPGIVKLRLTATGNDLNVIKMEVEKQVDELKIISGQYIFSFDRISLPEVIGEQLVEKNLSISTAESCSGGYLAHLFTSVAGSSRYFKGSVVAYDNEIKTNQLDVSPEDLIIHGAVSETVVITMAQNVRSKFKTSIGVAISGIAGPDGGTPGKPVGTVWMAYADQEQTITRKFSLGSDRSLNIHLSAIYSLNLIRQSLAEINGKE